MTRPRPGRIGRALTLVAVALGAVPSAAQEGLVIRSLGAPPAPIAALLARGGEGGPLRVAATALPLAYDDDAIPTLVVLELDGPTLLAGHPGGRLGLEIHAYAVAPGGRIAASLSEGVAVELTRRGEQLERDGLRWLAKLDLPPGDYDLRLFVLGRQTGAFALRAVRLLLPSRREGAAAFLAAVVPDRRPWVDAQSPTLGTADLAVVAEAGGPPSALPVLAAGSTARLTLWAGGGEPPRASLRLTDGRGQEAGTLHPKILGANRLGRGLVLESFEIDLPERTGLHDLRVEAEEGGVVSLPRRVVLRPDPQGAAWHQIARVDIASAHGPPPEPEPEQRTRSRVLQTRDALVLTDSLFTAWRRYSEGDREGAVAAHQAVEAAMLARDPRRSVERFDVVEAPLLERVASHDHASLLPLALFYRDLLRSHLASGQLPLARRAERVTERLLIRLANGAVDDDERRLAATALESVAAELIEIGATTRAVELIQRSTELVPGRASVWVALATLLERADDLPAAQEALDRALAAVPGDREARLRRGRLAVLGGASRRAAELFNQLLEEPVADWIGVVAAQERTRQLLDRSDYPGAARLLARLVDRWPQEPSLWVALAYCAERAGDRATSRRAVARAAAADRAFAVAPRKLYAEPPRLTLAAGRSRVETEGMIRLDVLAAALEAERPR